MHGGGGGGGGIKIIWPTSLFFGLEPLEMTSGAFFVTNGCHSAKHARKCVTAPFPSPVVPVELVPVPRKYIKTKYIKTKYIKTKYINKCCISTNQS